LRFSLAHAWHGTHTQIDEIHPHTSIWLRNPVILEGVDDLTKLSYMHEAAILHNLHMRYMTMQVYTYTGA
jgi:myosin heavy subunit